MTGGEMTCPITGVVCISSSCAKSQEPLSDPKGGYGQKLELAYGEEVGGVIGSTACSLAAHTRLETLAEMMKWILTHKT